MKLKRGRSNKAGTYSDPILKFGGEGELLHYSSSSKDLMLSQMDLSTSGKSVFSFQHHTLDAVFCRSYPKMLSDIIALLPAHSQLYVFAKGFLAFMYCHILLGNSPALLIVAFGDSRVISELPRVTTRSHR